MGAGRADSGEAGQGREALPVMRRCAAPEGLTRPFGSVARRAALAAKRITHIFARGEIVPAAREALPVLPTHAVPVGLKAPARPFGVMAWRAVSAAKGNAQISARGDLSPAARNAPLAGLCTLLLLAGCAAPGGGPDQPPRPKPARIVVEIEGPTADTPLLGSVSTRDGALQVLEPDGSVSQMRISSPQGRSALGHAPQGGLRLQDVIVEDSSIPVDYGPPGPTAQERAIEEFAARTRPALPDRISAFAPEDFIGAEIRQYRAPNDAGEGEQIVSVTVNLRRGVDESVGFAYATCTLAAWAETGQNRYARHIRSINANRGEVLAIESAYTMSRSQPLGLRVMETRQTLQDCRARGIPAGQVTHRAQAREGT